jgi:hypothetical protein
MNDLFQSTNDDQVELDSNKQYFEELVGEGKKFKTPEDLAKGKYHADQTINILERKLDEMRNDYKRLDENNKASAKLQDLIDQLTAKSNPTQDNNTQSSSESQPAVLDESKVSALVMAEMHKAKQAEREDENYKLVEKTLREKFGNNYKTILQEKTETLGLPKELINNLARQHPTVLFKTLGLDEQPSTNNMFQAPPRSAWQKDNFAPSTQKRTWSYYQELKKKTPNLYNDQKINQQMIEDYKALGKDFEDGDFNRY